MKFIIYSWAVIATCWLAIIIMAATGVGHPQDAAKYLEEVSVGAGVVTYFFALGAKGRGE